jgi:nucleoside-diphosphate-sugar epimerase
MPQLTLEKILVTGGTGFAIRHTIKKLVADGHSV